MSSSRPIELAIVQMARSCSEVMLVLRFTAEAKQEFTAKAPACNVLGFVHLGGTEPGGPPAEKVLLGKLWETFFNAHRHTCPLFVNSGTPVEPHTGDRVFSDKVVADK